MPSTSDFIATLIVHRPEGDLRIPVQTWSGGDLEPAAGKSRNPITGRSTTRGGMRERNNLTLTVECDPYLWSIKRLLEDSSGRDPYTAVRNLVDARRGPGANEAEKVTGIFGHITWPEFDIDGGDDTAMVEFEMSCDE